jgi:HSP20 family protein
VFETNGELVVRAEIGGLSRGEVQVEIAGDELRIVGERQVTRVPSRLYHESRVRYGPFEATIRLPFPVDAELAGADYADGFLAVTLPRLTPTTVTTRDERGPVEVLRGEE